MTSTERTEGISIVGGGEDITTGEDIDKGDGVGKSGPLDSGVCLESQSLACFVEKKRWKVHPGVATTDGRVSGDKEREVKVVVDVKKGELIAFNK